MRLTLFPAQHNKPEKKKKPVEISALIDRHDSLDRRIHRLEGERPPAAEEWLALREEVRDLKLALCVVGIFLLIQVVFGVFL